MAPTAATPPDGGYGWLVMVTSWCGQILVGAAFAGFGTLMADLAEHFQTSQAAVSVTGALFIGLLNLSSILTGGLIHHFGPRPVCMVGSLLATAALAITSFATNIYVTYFAYGLLGGLGNSAIFLSSIVSLQQYFDRRRAITTGIASSGLSIGTIIIGPLYRLLIGYYGWRYTLMIHAMVMLQGVVIGASFRPLSLGTSTPTVSKDKKPGPGEEDDKSRCRAVSSALVDWKLFKNKYYVLFMIGALLWQCGLGTMFSLSPSRAVSQGMDKFRASLIPSAIATCGLISRFANSFIANLKSTNVILQFGMLATASGVCICLTCTTSSFFGSLLFAGCYGLCFGGFMAIFPTVAVELVGIANISRAFGMLMSFSSVTALVAIPIGGRVYDLTSDYNIAFMLTGITATVGGTCTLLIFALRRRMRNKETSAATAPVVSKSHDIDVDDIDVEKLSLTEKDSCV